MKRTSWLALGVLTAVIGFVVYSSLMLGGVRCEICIEFRGRQACRSVDGTDEDETRRAATTNACAQIASGVTDSMACERTPPARASCQPH